MPEACRQGLEGGGRREGLGWGLPERGWAGAGKRDPGGFPRASGSAGSDLGSAPGAGTGVAPPLPRARGLRCGAPGPRRELRPAPPPSGSPAPPAACPRTPGAARTRAGPKPGEAGRSCVAGASRSRGQGRASLLAQPPGRSGRQEDRPARTPRMPEGAPGFGAHSRAGAPPGRPGGLPGGGAGSCVLTAPGSARALKESVSRGRLPSLVSDAPSAAASFFFFFLSEIPGHISQTYYTHLSFSFPL